MNGWIVLSIALGCALIGAVWQAVALDHKLDEVTAERDNERAERATSARTFAARKLLQVAHCLRMEAVDRFTALRPKDQRGAAFWDAAAWVSETYVRTVIDLPVDELRRMASAITRADR